MCIRFQVLLVKTSSSFRELLVYCKEASLYHDEKNEEYGKKVGAIYLIVDHFFTRCI